LSRRLDAEQVAESHPVWTLHGQSPTRQRRLREAGQAPVPAQVGEQDLTTPQRAVIAHPQPVVGHTQERAADPVLGRARCHVRVMVLDGDPAVRGEPLERVLGREVLAMQVVGHELGLQREQPRQVRETVRERPVGGQVLEIAVVRRDVRA
jgi:hypothetical protein